MATLLMLTSFVFGFGMGAFSVALRVGKTLRDMERKLRAKIADDLTQFQIGEHHAVVPKSFVETIRGERVIGNG